MENSPGFALSNTRMSGGGFTAGPERDFESLKSYAKAMSAATIFPHSKAIERVRDELAELWARIFAAERRLHARPRSGFKAVVSANAAFPEFPEQRDRDMRCTSYVYRKYDEDCDRGRRRMRRKLQSNPARLSMPAC